MDRYYLAALRQVPGLGPARIKRLCDFFGSAQQAWMAPKGDLFLCKGIPESVYLELLRWRDKYSVEKLFHDCEADGIRLLMPEDKEYPSALKTIYTPPELLFCKGIIPSTGLFIAIVGSRSASVYGKNAAQRFAVQLAQAGVTIISGAARGIDTAAHGGALQQGSTVAVLGCGIDQVYPPENKNLFDQIAAQGALISEYPPGTPPHSSYFPARNRIIAGLASGVLVVEAAEKSGSLITAELALNEGRDVFAVPGSIFSKLSQGTHRLIQQGAKLVIEAQDVLDEYELHGRRQTGSKNSFSAEEIAIYELISHENPISVEELIAKLRLSLSEITYTLLQLEINGWIVPYQQGYVRSAKEVDW